MKKQLLMSSEVAFSFKTLFFNQKDGHGPVIWPLPIIAPVSLARVLAMELASLGMKVKRENGGISPRGEYLNKMANLA
jgi:hypothetical protein